MASPVFVVLTASGTVWDPPCRLQSYFAILRDVYVYTTGGEVLNPPDKLLMGGKMVVERRLDQLAYDYCREEDEARWAAAAKVVEKHWPAWLPKGDGK